MRDAAADVPADYEPPLPFQARSLQHSRVSLTWDADDDGRKRALTRRLNADEVKEDDFRVRWGAVCVCGVRCGVVGHLGWGCAAAARCPAF